MIKVRSVALEDAKYLVEIYKPYVEETAITFDYSVPVYMNLKKK
jgi:phosphinothricin N-acetyltransferase